MDNVFVVNYIIIIISLDAEEHIPEPVNEELVVPVVEGGEVLEDVGEHRVGRLGREDRVLQQDQQPPHVVLPKVGYCVLTSTYFNFCTC